MSDPYEVPRDHCEHPVGLGWVMGEYGATFCDEDCKERYEMKITEADLVILRRISTGGDSRHFFSSAELENLIGQGLLRVPDGIATVTPEGWQVLHEAAAAELAARKAPENWGKRLPQQPGLYWAYFGDPKEESYSMVVLEVLTGPDGRLRYMHAGGKRTFVRRPTDPNDPRVWLFQPVAVAPTMPWPKGTS